MLGRSHAIIGAATGFTAVSVVEGPVGWRILGTAVGTFGGLWPDADTRSSLVGSHLPRLWHRLTPGHRGLTHSLYYCILNYFAVSLFFVYGGRHGWWAPDTGLYLTVAFVAGMVSHLLADSLTTEGIPLLYPWRKKFHVLGPVYFRTGHAVFEPLAIAVILSLEGALVSYPWIAPRVVGWIDTPDIYGVPTQPVVVFLAITLLFCLLQWARSTVLRRRSRRRRRAARRRIDHRRALANR